VTSPTKHPLISIITGTLDQSRYLLELLQSVAGQKVINFEHVIIDGQSTDGTRELLNNYQQTYAAQFPIHIHTYPPKGISDAMNKGIEHAIGDWIIVVHGDDYLEDSEATLRMEQAVSVRTTSSWIVGNAIRKYGSLTLNTRTFRMRPFLYRLLLWGINLLPHQNTLMRRELFSTYGPFLTNVKTHMDFEFYLRLLEDNVFPTAIDSSFVVFRRHLFSASLNPIHYIRSLQIITPRVREARQKVVWK